MSVICWNFRELGFKSESVSKESETDEGRSREKYQLLPPQYKNCFNVKSTTKNRSDPEKKEKRKHYAEHRAAAQPPQMPSPQKPNAASVVSTTVLCHKKRKTVLR